jgi:hypothetical protein
MMGRPEGFLGLRVQGPGRVLLGFVPGGQPPLIIRFLESGKNRVQNPPQKFRLQRERELVEICKN